ncbi:MAG: DUF971 domain-containing protein [Cycloclasticus sp.]|nr:DUF971 domain-containing protein [Cycloclasticus sp.]
MVTITDLALNQKDRILSLSFDDGRTIELSCEYLRVFSPSAEVRGHGPGQEVLQVGKEKVNIVAIEPVGNYAVRLVFSDEHDTGLYAWPFLIELAEKKAENWQDYLDRLEAAGHQRDAS